MGICKSGRKDCPCNRCTKGWWSRRHPTREAQDAARERYKEGRGPNMRRGKRRRK